jgi:hypothetical protein
MNLARSDVRVRADPPRSVSGAVIAMAVLGVAALLAVGVSERLRSVWWVLASALIVIAVVEARTEQRARALGPTDVATPERSGADGEVRSVGSSGDGTIPSPVRGEPVGSESPVPSRPPRGVVAAPAPPVDSREVPSAPGPAVRTTPTAGSRRPSAGLRGEGLRFSKSSVVASECEDAWDADLRRGRVAVADGASSAYLSGEWARLLTSAYVAETPAHELMAIRRWVDTCSVRWNDQVSQQMPAGGDDWWNEASARRGSFATLLGVRIGTDEVSGEACWDAVAVGDSCLVHVRPAGDRPGLQLLSSFPVESSSGFGGSPELVPTADAEGAAPVAVIRTATGTLAAGDVLLVMTDALAQWALGCEERGESPWGDLVSGSAEELGSLVAAARTDRTMVDDDVTLVRVHYDGPGPRS